MKKISELNRGARFTYGGVEWVKLWSDEEAETTLAVAAEPVFERAFDEDNCNDWRKSSLRRELNGPFLDALVSEGADRAAFLDVESDLTADDGMTDYGYSIDKIALLSCDLYRELREFIPRVGNWCWTLTPWTCDASNSFNVRSVYSSGVLSDYSACGGYGGVRPLCNLKSEILVSVHGEEDKPVEDRAAIHAKTVEEAMGAILDTLDDFPVEVWGEALGGAVASLLQSKLDAEGIAEEEKAAEG